MQTKDQKAERLRVVHIRMSKAIRLKPDATNEEIAAMFGVTPEYIAGRRIHLAENDKWRASCYGKNPYDTVATGRLIPVNWMKRNCSNGQRTVEQVQASMLLFGISLTVEDVKRSAERAGLPIHKRSRVIGTPTGGRTVPTGYVKRVTKVAKMRRGVK